MAILPTSFKQLSEILSGELPGWRAQQKLSSVGYDTHRIPPSDAKQAAVLALLYPDDSGALTTIFIKRPAHPHDKHSGQISFPGGQVEQQDADLWQTAIRECEEELGIPREDIQRLGALSSVYVFVSRFQVYPFVGYLSVKPKLTIQESEVAYPIHTALSTLRLPPKTKSLQVRQDVTLKDVPYWDLNGDTLWGATAMITSELIHLLLQPSSNS